MYLLGSRASAGFPSPADDYIEKSLDLNELLISNKVATFFMRVEGDAFAASGIREGDLLIVDRSRSPSSGKVVVAIIEGEFILRRIENQKDQLMFVSDDARTEAVLFDQSEIQVWGVVSAVVHQI